MGVIWNLYLWSTGRRVTCANVRQAFVPGVFFGLNLAVFFAGVTHNSVANAALIGSLAPFLIVPLGAWLFREFFDPGRSCSRSSRSAVSLLVLFNAPPTGDASLLGNVFGFARDVALWPGTSCRRATSAGTWTWPRSWRRSAR